VTYVPGDWVQEPACSCCKETYKADQEVIRLRAEIARLTNDASVKVIDDGVPRD